MRRYLLPLLLLSGGLLRCYNPSYIGPYACDESHGNADCPESFFCQAQLCVPPGTPPPDMYQPDLSPAEGCTQQATLLVMAHGARAWACEGSFAPGAFASLCSSAPGMHVCGQEAGDDSLLALIDCDKLTGFYLAQLNISLMQRGSNYDVRCDAPPGSNGNGILGCGTAAGTFSFNPDCHALHHALRCTTSGAGIWTCSPQMGLRDVTHYTTANGGTLCCSAQH